MVMMVVMKMANVLASLAHAFLGAGGGRMRNRIALCMSLARATYIVLLSRRNPLQMFYLDETMMFNETLTLNLTQLDSKPLCRIPT